MQRATGRGRTPGRPNPFAKITTRAAGAIGWTVSSIAPPRHCGSALETEQSRTIWKTHFLMPKASALRFHQSNGPRLSRALLALRKYSRALRHRRALADCFGANPVASALGDLARRDPGEAVRTYHEGRATAPITGTFYLAGNRNFLFGSDKFVSKFVMSSARTQLQKDASRTNEAL